MRFIQLYHQDWDHHGGLPGALPKLCKKPISQRPACKRFEALWFAGDTLVIWAASLVAPNYCQGKIQSNFGRDHHPRCYSIWMAGEECVPARSMEKTCEFGYNIVRDGLHNHDLHATMMHLLGIDHDRA